MKRADQEIPLVLAFTQNYFVPAAVCISSALTHAEETDCFHVICLLSAPLPEELQAQLHELSAERLRFSFINLQGQLQDIYVDEKFTVAASYRLLLPDLLPEYEKVIYMDCDIVVKNNIAKLFRETDLGENYVAGVFEATLSFQAPYIQSLGCVPGEYVNSGFLLMNLSQLRKDEMVARFVDASKVAFLLYQDQDVINQLCKGKILGLPPFYNGIRTFYLPQYKRTFLDYYTAQDWTAVQKHGTVHYTGHKPWNAFTVKFDEWWRFYDQLPTAIKGQHQVNEDMLKLYRIYATFPGKILINALQYVYRIVKYKKI